MSHVTQHPPIPMLDLSYEIDALWDDLNAAIQRVLRSGQFMMGPEVEAFEREVAAYLGVQYAVGVNSGTDALVIGLRALGIGPGDEVVTTPFSFFRHRRSGLRCWRDACVCRCRPQNLQSRARTGFRKHHPPYQSHPAGPPLRPARSDG